MKDEHIFDSFNECLRQTFRKAIVSDPEHRIAAIKESSYYLSQKITDLVVDTKKYGAIVEEWFTESVVNKLKEFPAELEVDLEKLKTDFPETEPLKNLIIDLEFGEQFGILGSSTDFRNIEKFKMTLFLEAINYFQFSTENLFVKDSMTWYTDDQLSALYIGIKRVMVHELSHILDSYQVDMEELLKDFQSKYADQKSELKAHESAFLYQFWREGHERIAKECDNIEDFKKKVKGLDCWNEIGPAMYTEYSSEKYEEFLEKLYDYLRSEDNILHEKHDIPTAKKRYTVGADIKGPHTQHEIEWATRMGKMSFPETYGLVPKPDFLERSNYDKASILFMWKYYKHMLRKDLIDEVEHYIKVGKLNVDDYLVKPDKIREHLDKLKLEDNKN